MTFDVRYSELDPPSPLVEPPPLFPEPSVALAWIVDCVADAGVGVVVVDIVLFPSF